MSKAKKTEKPDEIKVMVCGTITDMMYGKRTYKNGKKDKEDKYRLSLRLADGEMDKFIAACKPYYEDASEDFTPKFLKEDASDDDLAYLNFKSSYAFGFVQKTEEGFEDLGSFAEVSETYGNITGSKVVVTVKVKEGAFYPAAVCIVELHKKSLADFYEDFDFDELPFE